MAETFEHALSGAAAAFRARGLAMPALDARLLLCQATGLTHEEIIARGREMMSPGETARFEAFVVRRFRGEPVSRIRGSREFYGRDFRVDSSTLDPRPDTETLIDAALTLIAQSGRQERSLRLLDLGTGSGCILLTLLAELPHAQGVGTDMSEAALRCAAGNAKRLGVEARARFLAADWLAGIAGPFDLIVANPPYIARAEIDGLAPEVAAYDPRAALDGGADGLDAYRQIAAGALGALRPGGHLLAEIGATQAEAVQALFRASGLGPEAPVRFDLGGRPRCVVAGRPLEAGTGRRKPSKMSLENRDVRARFVAANDDMRSAGVYARPVARQQQERISREPRLTGSRASRAVQGTLNRPSDFWLAGAGPSL